MEKYWLVVGTPDHWRVAFESGNIWGLQGSKRRWWEEVTEGDGLVFYATRPVGGAIGLGKARTKFKQEQPLWPQEVSTGKARWPLRFEFDVDFCFPPSGWRSAKLKIDALTAIVQAGFQPLSPKATSASLEAFAPFVHARPTPQPQEGGIHEEIKRMLVVMGRIQKFLAEAEHPMDGARLDVVWRRVEKSVPTYVFEIHVGGDLYRALAKLKHAYDLWNSRIFVVAQASEKSKVDTLLKGTFHEIRDRLRFIEAEKVSELYSRKTAYREMEEELGIG
jgi:predicted RNA-binding protein